MELDNSRTLQHVTYREQSPKVLSGVKLLRGIVRQDILAVLKDLLRGSLRHLQGGFSRPATARRGHLIRAYHLQKHRSTVGLTLTQNDETIQLGTYRSTLLYLVLLLLLSNLNRCLSSTATSFIVLHTLLEALLSGGVVTLHKRRQNKGIREQGDTCTGIRLDQTCSVNSIAQTRFEDRIESSVNVHFC